MSLHRKARSQNQFVFLSGKDREGGRLCNKLVTASLSRNGTPKSLWLSTDKITTRFDNTHVKQFGRIKIIGLSLPFFINFVSAGYPSDVDDPYKRHLDLSKYLIRHPKSTYYFKVFGHEMIKAGINPHDLLVVDTALKPKHRDVVIAAVNGVFRLRRLHIDDGEIKLLSANPDFPAITITKEVSFFVQGVVTTVIRTFNPLPYDNHFKDISYPHI